jgi:hypothetical protein
MRNKQYTISYTIYIKSKFLLFPSVNLIIFKMRRNHIALLVKILIGVAFVILLALAIVLPIVLLTKSDLKSDNQGTSKPSLPEVKKPFNFDDLRGDEATRIDCYLEAQSRFENLTKYSCEKRNCIYDANVSHEIVPKCYFDREKLGYKLTSSSNGLEYKLKQSGKTPFPGVIEDIQLNVEYYGNNMIRVKVVDAIDFISVFKLKFTFFLKDIRPENKTL